MSFIAGPYTVTYKAINAGQIQDGIRLIENYRAEPIIGDSYGDSEQDEVYRGGNVHFLFTLMEWDKIIDSGALYPHAARGVIGQVGRLPVQQSLVGALIFTAVAGTPAATQPASITVSKAKIARDFDIETFFGNRLRAVPVRMQAFPYSSSALQRWYLQV